MNEKERKERKKKDPRDIGIDFGLVAIPSHLITVRYVWVSDVSEVSECVQYVKECEHVD